MEKSPNFNELLSIWYDVLEEMQKQSVSRLSYCKLTRTEKEIEVEIKDELLDENTLPKEGDLVILYPNSEQENQIVQRPIGGTVEKIVVEYAKSSLKIRIGGFKRNDLPKIASENGEISIQDIGNKISIQRQFDAIRKLKGSVRFDRLKNPQQIKGTLLQTNNSSIQDIQWFSLSIKDSESQQQAVLRALHSQDIFMIQGPPGTGKTTVIAELVLQIIHQNKGKSILISSQTHIAVDNALEKIVDALKNFTAPSNKVQIIRAGQVEQKENIEPSILPFLFENRLKTWGHEIIKGNRAKLATVHIAERQLWENWQSEIECHYDTLAAAYLDKLLHSSDSLVVGATCIGLAGNPHIHEINFDWVIIDEAGRATIPEILVPMLQGKKIILIGDHYQLPPTINEKVQDAYKRIIKVKCHNTTQISLHRALEPFLQDKKLSIKDPNGQLFQKNDYRKIEEAYEECLGISLFEHLFELIPEDARWLLNTQYRMHPHIGDMISECFYSSGIENGKNTYDRSLSSNIFSLPAIVWHSIKQIGIETHYEVASDKRRGYKNEAEAEAIVRWLEWINIKCQRDKKVKIGIITGYRHQKQLLQQKIPALYNIENVEIDTVDSYQGRDRDIIIFSVVSSSKKMEHIKSKMPIENEEKRILGFLRDKERINVALSRAKEFLLIVGNEDIKNVNILSNSLKEVFNVLQVSFILTDSSLKSLREYIPKNVLNALKPIIDKEVKGEKNFLNAIKKQIGQKQTEKYKEIILKYTKLDENEQKKSNRKWIIRNGEEPFADKKIEIYEDIRKGLNLLRCYKVAIPCYEVSLQVLVKHDTDVFNMLILHKLYRSDASLEQIYELVEPTVRKIFLENRLDQLSRKGYIVKFIRLSEIVRDNLTKIEEILPPKIIESLDGIEEQEFFNKGEFSQHLEKRIKEKLIDSLFLSQARCIEQKRRIKMIRRLINKYKSIILKNVIFLKNYRITSQGKMFLEKSSRRTFRFYFDCLTGEYYHKIGMFDPLTLAQQSDVIPLIEPERSSLKERLPMDFPKLKKLWHGRRYGQQLYRIANDQNHYLHLSPLHYRIVRFLSFYDNTPCQVYEDDISNTMSDEDFLKAMIADEGKKRLREYEPLLEKMFLKEDDFVFPQSYRHSQITILPELEHPRSLLNALETAKSGEKIIILSGWIASNVVNKDFKKNVCDATTKGAKIIIGYGFEDKEEQELQNQSSNKRRIQKEREKAEKILNNLARQKKSSEEQNFFYHQFGTSQSQHAKVLIHFPHYAIISSFNWLSYSGRADPAGRRRIEYGIRIEDEAFVNSLSNAIQQNGTFAQLASVQVDTPQSCHILSTNEHRERLFEALNNAKSGEQIIITSGWIGLDVVNDENNDFINSLKTAIEKETTIWLGYGFQNREELSPTRKVKEDSALQKLCELKCSLDTESRERLQIYRFPCRRQHSKVLLCNRFLVVTSFNWLSFNPDKSRTERIELGVLVKDKNVIQTMFDELNRLFTNEGKQCI